MRGFVCASLLSLAAILLCSPRVRARGIVVNRLNPQRTAFLAGMIILGTCAAGGQTPPLLDPSVAQEPLARLSAADPVVHKGLFTIDVDVTDAAGNPVSDLAPWDFTLLDNGRPARIRTFHNSLAPLEPAPELIFVLDTINLSPQQLDADRKRNIAIPAP